MSKGKQVHCSAGPRHVQQNAVLILAFTSEKLCLLYLLISHVHFFFLIFLPLSGMVSAWRFRLLSESPAVHSTVCFNSTYLVCSEYLIAILLEAKSLLFFSETEKDENYSGQRRASRDGSMWL